MSDNLYCNVTKCKTIITEIAWVTRCLHIFCPDHGKSYFNNSLPQINCPVCNEMNTKETDIVQCELNPNDMILAGLDPEKAINAAINSIKLRKQQTIAENNHNLAQLEYLGKKLIKYKYIYEKTVRKLKADHSSEVAALKACYDEAMKKLNKMTQDLEIANESKKKYQIAYNSMLLTNKNAEKIFPRERDDPPNLNTHNFFEAFTSPPVGQASPAQSILTSENFLIRHFNI